MTGEAGEKGRETHITSRFGTVMTDTFFNRTFYALLEAWSPSNWAGSRLRLRPAILYSVVTIKKETLDPAMFFIEQGFSKWV